jgi:hypothetical protein
MRLNALPSLLFVSELTLAGPVDAASGQGHYPAGRFTFPQQHHAAILPVTMAFRNAVIALKCAVERTKYKQYD